MLVAIICFFLGERQHIPIKFYYIPVHQCQVSCRKIHFFYTSMPGHDPIISGTRPGSLTRAVALLTPGSSKAWLLFETAADVQEPISHFLRSMICL